MKSEDFSQLRLLLGTYVAAPFLFIHYHLSNEGRQTSCQRFVAPYPLIGSKQHLRDSLLLRQPLKL